MHPVSVPDHHASPKFTAAYKKATRDRKLSYRADIDGLRAIAVLSVLTFHCFPAKAMGGFVGVDMFFVISGYLISAIIYKDLEAGSFSIVDFYIRRVLRIYPALLLVLASVCVAGWVFLLPSAFILLGKQIVGGSTFIANIVLWLQSGYFSPQAAFKPLLHLWSLGVEEQFYLIFPVICVALYRARSRWALPFAFFVLAFTSMALNVALVDHYRDAVFFLPLTRLWELLLGVGLSLFLHWSPLSSPPRRFLERWRSWIGALGLVMLLFSIFMIDEFHPFPGWWALLPTVGSTLVIAAGESAWTNRHLLSSRLAAFVGLVSYPLYLWHWPVLCFARIATNNVWGTDLSHVVKLLLMGLSFVLAYLTYRLIELPVRHVRERKLRRKGALWLLGSVLLTGVFGAVVIWKNGFPSRFPTAVVALDHDYGADVARAWREGSCFLRADQLPEDFGSDCLDPVRGTAAQPLVFVWGDSHAADLMPGFHAQQRLSGVRLAQYTSASCPPLIGFRDKLHPPCMPVNNDVLQRIRTLKPDVVVLSASWDRGGVDQPIAERADELYKTIRLVNSAGVEKVVVVGSAPSWTSGVPALLIDQLIHNPNRLVPTTLPKTLLEPHNDRLIQSAARNAGAVYIPLFEDLCDRTSCVVATGQSWRDVLTYDKAHFTEHGSILVANRIWGSSLPSEMEVQP